MRNQHKKSGQVINKSVAARLDLRRYLHTWGTKIKNSYTGWFTPFRKKAKRAVRRWLFFVDAVSYRKPLAVKKIIQYKDGNCYPVCPRCTISMDREYMSYCDRCGQRLSWHRFDNAEIIYPGRK